MLDDIYNEKYKEAREKWVVWYFSWIESKSITEAELHTARDGFDAGANWREKSELSLETMIKNINALSKEDQLIILNHIKSKLTLKE